MDDEEECMSGKKIAILIFVLAICLSSVSEALADIIYLTNGKKITGTIVKNTDEYVKIDCMNLGLYVTYKKEYVQKIEAGDLPAPKVLLSLPSSAPAEAAGPDASDRESVPQEAVRPKSDNSFELDSDSPQMIEETGYIIYLPAGLSGNKRYPLVVMFDPGGNAQGMINMWKGISDRRKWILYASKKFRNGIEDWIAPEFSAFKEIVRKYPIDKRRVVTTGISGGGMGAHMMAFFHPEMVRAVITNVGRINPSFMSDQGKKEYPRKKLAVFLAGTKDFNYKQMIEDCKFLKDLGWSTDWIEFDGGHEAAPPEVYERAADWLEDRW